MKFCNRCDDITTNVSENCQNPSIKYTASKFAVGQEVFVIKKAKRGVLEFFTIAFIYLNSSRSTFGRTVIVYSDKDNRLWLEQELCTKEEAVAYAIARQQQILEQS